MFIYSDTILSDLGFESTSDTIGILPQVKEKVLKIDGLAGVNYQGLNFGPRQFELEGIVIADTIEQLEANVTGLCNLFSTPGDLRHMGESDKYLHCELAGKIRTRNTALHCELSIPLIAVDPFWYSCVLHDLYMSPNTVYSVTNLGNFPSRNVLLKMLGPSTDPEISIAGITHKYTGALASVDQIWISMFDRTARYNQTANAKTYNKKYSALNPGENLIMNKVGNSYIQWRDCWL